MKIVSINGSPRGKLSNTNLMVSAFMKGAKDSGAEIENIYLSEKNIEYCKGCHSCWFENPGVCVIEDDMVEVLSLLGGVSVIVLASPIFFNNISGTLKVFMDRLTVIGNPYQPKKDEEKNQDLTQTSNTTPKLVMISNCGLPDRSQFEVVSLWIKKVAKMMQSELIGEIYAIQGKLLANPPKELEIEINNYMKLLEKAGKEISTNMKLSEETEKRIAQNFM